MSKIIEEVEGDITTYYEELMDSYGVNPTMIRIYMAIFFSNKPLGLQEISEKSGYSVSTVCNMMDIIEKLTDINKFKKPGSKKVYYECVHDIKKAVRKKVIEQKATIEKIITLLHQCDEKLSKETDEDAILIKHNLEKMRKDYEKVSKIFDVLQTVKLIG